MRARALALASLCLAASTGVLHAQAPARADAEPPRTATGASAESYPELITLALREFESGHWEEARAMFERAHALNPNARTLRGLGVTAFELRRYVQAAGELEASLVDQRNPLTPELRQEVELALARTRGFIGTLQVNVKPSKARVLVDGAEVHVRELVLEVGEYELRISAAGYREARLRVSIEGGEQRPIALELVRIPLDAAASRAPQAGSDATAALADDESGSLLESPWFWTAAGAVVAGVVAGALLLSSEDEARLQPGDVGGIVQVLRARP